MKKDVLKLKELLELALKRNLGNSRSEKLGFLFSGGVDSSLVIKLAEDLGFRGKLLTLAAKTSKDVAYTEQAPSFLLSEYLPIPVELPDVSATLPLAKNILTETGIEKSIMQLSLTTAMILCARKASQLGITALITGQGSDELFAGYAKYRRVEPKALPEILEGEIRRLQKVDLKRDATVADHYHLRLITPFTDTIIINFADELPIERKINPEQNKIIVRDLASLIGVPLNICRRPKKAFQYSSGLQTLVQKVLNADRKKGCVSVADKV